jgi:hypothetical protein
MTSLPDPTAHIAPHPASTSSKMSKSTFSFAAWWQWLLSFFRSPKPKTLKSKTEEYKIWTVREPWLNIHCGLGEGPYYEPATNTLRFVDIKKRQLHTVGLAEGPRSLKTLNLGMPVGVTADIEGVDSSKRILIGGKSAVYILDRETGGLRLLRRFHDTEEKDDRLRSNDGAVDPQGRFWIATMNDFGVGPPQAEGESKLFLHLVERRWKRRSCL